MIKKLHLKLTIFLSSVLAAVIICMSGMLAYTSASEYENSMYSSYSQDMGLLYSYLTQSSLLDSATIGRYVRSNYYICISSNMETIYETDAFPHSKELAELASPYKQTDYWTDYYDFLNKEISVRNEYTYKYGHTTYWNSYFLLNMSSSILTVHVIYNNQIIQNHNARRTAVYFTVALAAIVILAIFSRLFLGRVLVPVEEAYRKQDEFIAVASHELKAPLTIIKSCMYSLSGGMNPSDYVSLANRECSHMADIVDNLLSFARIKQADADSFEPTDPADIIIECYSRFENVAISKGLSLQVVLPEEPLAPIPMDRERMIQCISILTDNAIEYTDEGSVTLSVDCENRHSANQNAIRRGARRVFLLRKKSRIRRKEAHSTTTVVFRVIDTGIGVPDELKEKIFEKFYSTHRKGGEVSSHAGLGLAIADEIARLHGAGITVRDNEPRGSVFEVRL